VGGNRLSGVSVPFKVFFWSQKEGSMEGRGRLWDVQPLDRERALVILSRSGGKKIRGGGEERKECWFHSPVCWCSVKSVGGSRGTPSRVRTPGSVDQEKGEKEREVSLWEARYNRRATESGRRMKREHQAWLYCANCDLLKTTELV